MESSLLIGGNMGCAETAINLVTKIKKLGIICKYSFLEKYLPFRSKSPKEKGLQHSLPLPSEFTIEGSFFTLELSGCDYSR